MISQGYFINRKSHNDASRKVIIKEIDDNSLLDTILNFELQSKPEYSRLAGLETRFKVTAFALKIDGILFGHAVCFYDKIDNLLLFGYFGTYSQNPTLNNCLLKRIISFSRRLEASFILGPINILSSDKEMGFHEHLDNDYIKSCKDSGFLELQKRNMSLIMIKYLDLYVKKR